MAKNEGVGKPTKLTPKIRKQVCDGIRSGHYATTVMKRLGLSEGNHWVWYRKGENGQLDHKGRRTYILYKEAVDQAEAEAEEKVIQHWTDQFSNDWKAAAEFAARRWKDRWGKEEKVKQEMTGKDGGPINVDMDVDLSNLSDEELNQLENILSKTTNNEITEAGEGEEESD